MKMCTFICCLILVTPLFAASVVYEGRLVDANGAVRTNTSLLATLKLYDEKGTVIKSLGDVTISTDAAGNFSLYTPSFSLADSQTNVWLAVEAEGQEVSPRKFLASAPYAIHAKEAYSLETDSLVLTGGLIANTKERSSIASLELENGENARFNSDCTVVGNSFAELGSVYFSSLELSKDRYFSGMSSSVSGGGLWKTGDYSGAVFNGHEQSAHLSRTDPKCEIDLGQAQHDGFVTIHFAYSLHETFLATPIGLEWAFLCELRIGDFVVMPARKHPLHSSSDWSNVILTFPVRQGEKVLMTLDATHRYDHYSFDYSFIVRHRYIYFGKE